MNLPKAERPSLSLPPNLPGGGPQRRAVSVASHALVSFEPLSTGVRLPLLARPAAAAVDLLAWLRGHRDEVRRHLLAHGGVLFRGFGVASEAELQAAIETVAGELVQYTYRSTPRTALSGKIYTSTEYPADQEIPLHNEMSYSHRWPLKIGFLCVTAAAEGGETPIADSRATYAAVAPEVREAFATKRVMYVRNYGEGVDLPWQEVFQTQNRAEVEAFCAASGIGVEWKGKDRLRTRQICQGVANHPESGEPVWFNQAHLFHVSSLLPAVRRSLEAEFAPDELPRNAFFGDGSAISEEALAEVRRALVATTVVFPWQPGDLLLLDNMLAAHGRRPYTGTRKIVVGMAEPYSLPEATA